MDKIDQLKNKEFIQGKTQEIIENYKNKAGVNKKLQVFTTDGERNVSKHTVPSWLKKGEEWENPINGKKWKRDENGLLSSGRRDIKNEVSPKICPKCSRYLKSKNDINIRLQTGKCIRCHSDAELDAIVNGEEYTPPSWKGDILIKDSTGKIVMDIDEYQQEYGNQMTFMFLNKLVQELDEKKQNNENINEAIYKNAVERKNILKDKINSEIKKINDITEEMMKNGEISEELTDEEMQKVLEKINNIKNEK